MTIYENVYGIVCDILTSREPLGLMACKIGELKNIIYAAKGVEIPADTMVKKYNIGADECSSNSINIYGVYGKNKKTSYDIIYLNGVFSVIVFVSNFTESKESDFVVNLSMLFNDILELATKNLTDKLSFIGRTSMYAITANYAWAILTVKLLDFVYPGFQDDEKIFVSLLENVLIPNQFIPKDKAKVFADIVVKMSFDDIFIRYCLTEPIIDAFIGNPTTSKYSITL